MKERIFEKFFRSSAISVDTATSDIHRLLAGHAGGKRHHPPRCAGSGHQGQQSLIPKECDGYLISTLAPTSSNFFLMLAASSLETPSFRTPGAPSTRSLASLRPRLVTSRTTLIVLILSPAAARWTVNSVFSSSAGAAAAAAPPPAAATGIAIAAAETPNFSSSALTRVLSSRTVMPSISFTNVSAVIAMIVPLSLSLYVQQQLLISVTGSGFGRPGLRLLVRDLAQDARQISDRSVQHRHQAPQGRLHDEEQLRDQLLARRELGDRLDLGGRYGPPLDHGRLEHQVRVGLGEVRQDLRERHRVRLVVGHRRRPGEVLGHGLEGRSLGRPQRERVLDHEVLRLRPAHLAAQLRHLGDLEAREREQDRVRGLREVARERLDHLGFFG